MKKILPFLILLISTTIIYAQDPVISITSPAGMTEPYEAALDTEITLEADITGLSGWADGWYYSTEEPDEGYNGTHTGNYDLEYTHTLTEDIYIWFVYYVGDWIQTAHHSNVIHITVSSACLPAVLPELAMLCPEGSVELFMDTTGHNSYQWYNDTSLIEGATNDTLLVTEPGTYSVQVTSDSCPDPYSSNACTVELIEPDFTIDLADYPATAVLSTADTGSYQWMSGTDIENLTEITGETSDTYSFIPGAETYYYAVKVLADGCSSTSVARPVSNTNLQKPVIVDHTVTNYNGTEENLVCLKDTVKLDAHASDDWSSYKWYYYSYGNWYAVYGEEDFSLEYSRSYAYTTHLKVEVGAIEGWEDIVIESDSVSYEWYGPSTPTVSLDYAGYYVCPNTEVTATIDNLNSNASYTWYHSESYGYHDTNQVDPQVVTDFIQQYTFETTVNNTYLTVLTELDGCSATSNKTLNSYLSSKPYITAKLESNNSSYYKEYLCEGTSLYLYYSDYSNAFLNPQWYKIEGEDTVLIEDAANDTLYIDIAGSYLVKVESNNCPGNFIYSNPKVFKDYSEYVPELKFHEIYDGNCLGNTMTLSINDNYNNQFSNFLWYENEIDWKSSKYTENFALMTDFIEEDTLITTTYKKYFAKATHEDCPSVLLSTDTLLLLPKYMPETLYDGDFYANQITVFGEAPSAIYCMGDTAHLTVDSTYEHYGAFESFQWTTELFDPPLNFDLGQGTAVDGETNPNTNAPIDLNWYSCIVTDTLGCKGVSRPVLIDQWAFLNPVITSYGNSEFCEEGDSVLFHLGFPGDWDRFEWHRDGTIIPDSDNDTIWAKKEGMYTITAYPNLCPDIPHSSGVGPTASFMPDAEIMENDTLIYGMPFFGWYEFQWYLDGDSVPEEDLYMPHVLLKEDMDCGMYGLQVTNDSGCKRTAEEEYEWRNPADEVTVDASICEGDSYFVGGENQTEAGTYIDYYYNTNGCDSIVTTNLAVNSLPVVNLGNDTTITESITLDAGEGYVAYLWNTLEETQTILVDNSYGYGTHSFDVLVTDENSCQGGDTILITIEEDISAGLLDAHSLVMLYPNPSNGLFTVELNDIHEHVLLQIVSLEGKVIMQKEFSSAANLIEELDITVQESGWYYLIVKTESFVKTEKFSIVK